MKNVAGGSNIDVTLPRIPNNFWAVFLENEQLAGCDNLEKLVAGCEVIAALDQIDELLAA
ncbi:MAG TPA: hypothetical protein VJ719_05200 [Chthoniobacterales bacterium]|nr:hypothetical protein [Chthoniobacterales bacterium]